jgi:hypothetical protein
MEMEMELELCMRPPRGQNDTTLSEQSGNEEETTFLYGFITGLQVKLESACRDLLSACEKVIPDK